MRMREVRSRVWVGMGMFAVLLLAGAGPAMAQAPVTRGGVSPTGNTYLGPYANPYMAPGMTPYLMAAPYDPQAGMLTFLYLQRAGNGIGSGKLSNGTAFRGQTQPAGVRSAAYMPRSVARPTSGAERYFGRVPDRGAPAADYFHRSTPSRRR